MGERLQKKFLKYAKICLYAFCYVFTSRANITGGGGGVKNSNPLDIALNVYIYHSSPRLKLGSKSLGNLYE